MRPTIVLFACLAGCSKAAPDQAGEVTRLADEYVAAFFQRRLNRRRNSAFRAPTMGG